MGPVGKMAILGPGTMTHTDKLFPESLPRKSSHQALEKSKGLLFHDLSQVSHDVTLLIFPIKPSSLKAPLLNTLTAISLYQFCQSHFLAPFCSAGTESWSFRKGEVKQLCGQKWDFRPINNCPRKNY